MAETDNQEWARELREIGVAAERARETLSVVCELVVGDIVGADALPREIREPWRSLLESLAEDLCRIQEKSSDAINRYCGEPLGRFGREVRLNREQYYLLRAMGALTSSMRCQGGPNLDDYEIFGMLQYEDDDQLCYINPDERPREPGARVRLRFGKPPEELRLSALRSEQRAFFEQYAPDVLARFKDDK